MTTKQKIANERYWECAGGNYTSASPREKRLNTTGFLVDVSQWNITEVSQTFSFELQMA